MLQEGIGDAATLGAPWFFFAAKQGYMNAGHEPDYSPGVTGSSLYAHPDRVKQDPALIGAFVRAYVRSVRYCQQNVPGTLETMQKFSREWGVTDEEVAQAAYDEGPRRPARNASACPRVSCIAPPEYSNFTSRSGSSPLSLRNSRNMMSVAPPGWPMSTVIPLKSSTLFTPGCAITANAWVLRRAATIQTGFPSLRASSTKVVRGSMAMSTAAFATRSIWTSSRSTNSDDSCGKLISSISGNPSAAKYPSLIATRAIPTWFHSACAALNRSLIGSP